MYMEYVVLSCFGRTNMDFKIIVIADELYEMRSKCFFLYKYI